MNLADAPVPPQWSTYSMAVCIALVICGAVMTLFIGLIEGKPATRNDPEEGQ